MLVGGGAMALLVMDDPARWSSTIAPT